MTARRTLSVFVDELAIADGAIPPPRVGHVSQFALSFSESVPVGHDTTTIRAVLDPNRPPPDARPQGFEWSGLLRGDGWTATWSATRPLVGQVEIAGWFRHMYDDHRGGTRGRVTRIRLVTVRYRADNHAPPWWEPTAGHQIGMDLDEAPRFFDRRALHTEPDNPSATCDGPIGVLVDLDLDDVPPLPPRPRVVPGDVSACGDVVWVLDRDLPVVVRLDANDEATEHLLPAPVGYVSKHVHATPTGCWVVGADGVHRCSVGESARLVDGRPVTVGAARDETLLACRTDGAWTLYPADGESTPVAAPSGFVSSVIAWRDGFLAALVTNVSNADSCTEYRLVKVLPNGEVTVGPVCCGERDSPGGPVIGGDPASVLAGGLAAPIAEDLSAVTTMSLGRMHFGGGSAGPYIWTVCHASDRPGCVGRWTRTGSRCGSRTPSVLGSGASRSDHV